MVLYSGYYLLPFRCGWLKALTLSAAAAAVFVGMSVHRFGSPWHYAGWMIFASLGILTIGFDLKGIVGDRTSEAETFMYGLGFDTFGNLFRAKGFHKGNVTQSKSKCINCETCRMVCPVGVYGIGENRKDVVIIDDSACLKCNACVTQCPEEALSLS